MGLLLLLTSTAIIATAAWRFARRLRVRGRIEQLVAALVLSSAGVLGLTLLTGGVLRSYDRAGMALGALAIGGLELWWTRRSPLPARSGTPVRSWLTGRTGWEWAQWTAAGALLVLVCGQYAWRVLLAVTLPPTDWDGLQRHLVGPAVWIQAGRLTHSPQSEWADSLPLTVESFGGWTGVFLHTMRYAPLAQLPLYLLAGLSVAGLARRAGAGRAAALLAGLVLLASPAVFAQAGTSYVDVSATAFALAALYLVTGLGSAWQPGEPGLRVVAAYACLTGVAAGLAAGSRMDSLLLVPVLAAVLFVVTIRRHNAGHVSGEHAGLRTRKARRLSRSALRPAALALAGLAVPVLLLGSFWYLRAWATHGNPFHPFTVAGFPGRGAVADLLAGASVTAELGTDPIGRVARSWLADLSPQAARYDMRSGGFGVAWLVVVLPAALAALAASRRRLAGPVPLLGAVALLALVVSPAPWWARYTLLPLAIGSALAAASITRWNAGNLRILAAGTTAALVALTSVSMWWASSSTPICAAERCPAGTLLTPHGAVALLSQPDRHQRLWPWNQYRILGALPRGSVIAVPKVPSTPFPLAVMGERLERKMVAVEAPDSADRLADVLDRQHASHVLLDPAVHGSLARAVARDPRFALRSAPSERVFGSDLFAYGPQATGCPEPLPATLTAGLAGTAGEASGLRVSVMDGCGRPMRAEVRLYAGDPAKALWQDDVALAEHSSDAGGTVTFALPARARPWRYFASVQATEYHDALASATVIVPPAATAEPAGD
ncbi:hypothetical protein [Longispora albida]|uniref:hypothetical protein n=1 Tax=Longispora albida TaxID=203523 RepID=UPI0003663EA4|nr:hypothetical protein [Longispora albida]